jgi:phosphatidylinositol 4-kinase
MIYAEVIEVDDIQRSAVPPKCTIRQARSVENLLVDQQLLSATGSKTGSRSNIYPEPPVSRKSDEGEDDDEDQGIVVNSPTTSSAPPTTVHLRSSSGYTSPQSSTTSNSNLPATTNSSCMDLNIDCWSQEDDEISQQYLQLKSKRTNFDRDTISQMSIDSCDSREPVFISAVEIRRRLSESLHVPKSTFQRDPEDPSASVLKEPFEEKVSI